MPYTNDMDESLADGKHKKAITKQFAAYLVAAGCGYIVDFGTLYILHDFMHIHYLIAAAFGFIFGLVVVYIMSSRFVFGSSKLKSKSLEIGIFALVGVVGLGILSVLMFLFTGLLGVNYLIAKIIATVAVYVWNFFARRSLYHN